MIWPYTAHISLWMAVLFTKFLPSEILSLHSFSFSQGFLLQAHFERLLEANQLQHLFSHYHTITPLTAQKRRLFTERPSYVMRGE